MSDKNLNTGEQKESSNTQTLNPPCGGWGGLISRFVPIPIENIDTDQIIPARFLKATTKDGFGKNLFRDWRYYNDDESKTRADFPLNMSQFDGEILVAGKNFGCGSSREHAPIAIKAAGIQAVVAKSFARIFYRNAFNIGLPIFESEAASEAVKEGDEIEIDADKGVIRNLTTKVEYKANPIPPFMQELIASGGLVAWTKRKLAI